MTKFRNEPRRLRNLPVRIRQTVDFALADIDRQEAGWVLMSKMSEFANERDRTADAAPRHVRVSDDDALAIVSHIASVAARIPD